MSSGGVTCNLTLSGIRVPILRMDVPGNHFD